MAQYLLQFVKKSKYNQDSIILEWYKYAMANNFGIVNHSHNYGNGSIDNHMYYHVYHEGVGKKGGTNIAS